MPSTVSYYRPGGVPGIYAVQVRLELQPSQWAKVDIGRYRDRGYHCGSCGHQHPINPLQTETQRIERYAEFRDIWERDTITIEIHNRDLGEEGPYQIVVYTASRTGIQADTLPCTRHGRTWRLEFTTIDLIDAGASPIPSRRSEEEPEKSEQVVKDLLCVRNGFAVRGLLALPVARQDRPQYTPLPVSQRKADERVALLN